MNCNKLIISSFLMFLLISSAAMAQDFNENGLTDSTIPLKKQVQLYPNPAPEFLFIEVTNDELETTTFEIRSIIGNEMKIDPEKIGMGKYRIKVKEFAPGYYFLVVKDDERRFNDVYKFLKN